jgi:hypothetical protein
VAGSMRISGLLCGSRNNALRPVTLLLKRRLLQSENFLKRLIEPTSQILLCLKITYSPTHTHTHIHTGLHVACTLGHNSKNVIQTSGSMK